MQVAVDDGRQLCWRQALRGVEEAFDERRSAPDAEPPERGELLARQRHAHRHVGAGVRVQRQRLVEVEGVERAQEAGHLECDLEARVVVELRVARLAAR